MTRGEIWKDFLKHTVLALVIALFLFLIFKAVFTKNGETEYFYVWLCCGIPFGIRRMFFWLVPQGRRPDRRGHPDLASGGCCMVYSSHHLSVDNHRQRK